MPDEYSLKGNLDFLLHICDILTEIYEFSYNELSRILGENPGKYDLLIADSSATLATLVAAERFNIPTIIQSPGLPGGTDCIQDKWPITMFELFLMKPFGKKCWSYINDKRAELKLPELDFQGEFMLTEYSDRFPMVIPMSPSFYPKPHPNVDHIYLGGLRNVENLPELSPELIAWMDRNDKQIVYISLGTHSVLDETELKDFVDNLKSQSKYRFIWSLGIGLENMAKSLGIFSEDNDMVYLSDFLPQYTLLGHPKVKLYVSHCGLGSMVDLIARKIPGVFVPQFSDQFSNAAKLESLSLGVSLKEFKYDQLIEAIEKVFANYKMHKSNLERLQKEFEEYENYDKINEFANKIAARKQISVQYDLPYEVNCSRFHAGWKVVQGLVVILGLLSLIIVSKIVVKIAGLQQKKEKSKTNWDNEYKVCA